MPARQRRAKTSAAMKLQLRNVSLAAMAEATDTATRISTPMLS